MIERARTNKYVASVRNIHNDKRLKPSMDFRPSLRIRVSSLTEYMHLFTILSEHSITYSHTHLLTLLSSNVLNILQCTAVNSHSSTFVT